MDEQELKFNNALTNLIGANISSGVLELSKLVTAKSLELAREMSAQEAQGFARWIQTKGYAGDIAPDTWFGEGEKGVYLTGELYQLYKADGK